MKYMQCINIDGKEFVLLDKAEYCNIKEYEVLCNRNSGHRNSGHRNSGDWNSGDWNSGDENSGHRNSGYENSGDRNSGDENSGHRNSGHRNSGDCNSGDLNSGNYSSGVFCTKTNPTIKLFDRDSDMTMKDWRNHPAYYASMGLTLNEWVGWSDMTDEEKEEYPKAEICDGYLKTYEYREAWANLWNTLTDEQKNSFKTLPNFDSDKFMEITGVDISNKRCPVCGYKFKND